ncbi:MAG: hypothetical protein KDD94_15570, partial [Calditrichaeota bacterium]|nr:hypothetical protein [Calditrichota bacterium]
MASQFLNHFKILFVLILIFINPFLFADNFKYSELQIKDYNEMLNQVKDYIQNSKKLSIENQKKGDDETG